MTVFYATNFLDNATLSATNENASFPISNLQDHRRTKVFRSTGVSSVITIDMHTSEPVDSIVMTSNPLTGFGFVSPITIEAHITDEWSSPSYSTTITAGDIDQKHGFAYKEFISQEYRFWRLSFTGSSFIEVSNIFIGSKISLSTNDINKDFKFVEDEIVNKSENIYRQKFFDIVGDQRMLSGNFRYMNKTEIDLFFEMYDNNGSIKPIYFRLDCDILNEINRFSGMYFFDKKPELSHVINGLYNLDFKLEEAK